MSRFRRPESEQSRRRRMRALRRFHTEVRASAPAGEPLVVPLQVDALCVGHEAQGSLGGPTTDFSGLDGTSAPYLGSSVSADPTLPSDATEPLPPGVHLHWWLPGAYTEARADNTTPDPTVGVALPAAPTRWLVVRTLTRVPEGGAPTTTTTAWVVESDQFAQTPRAMSPPQAVAPIAWPVDPDTLGKGQPGFGYLGAVAPASSWVDSGAALSPPLTAHGFGSIWFSAYYLDCRSVFGFCDPDPPTTDSETTLSYVVMGWHADGTDPAQRYTGDFVDDNPFGWRTSPGAPVSRTFLSGAVLGVPWKGPTRAYLTAPVVRPSATIIANTSIEAIAKLATATAGSSTFDTWQEFLAAVQAGLLAETDAWDVDAGLQALTFDSSQGEQLIQARSTGDTPPGEQQPPIPASVVATVDAWNASSTAAAVDRWQSQTRASQLYADWCALVISNVESGTTGGGAGPKSSADLGLLILGECAELQGAGTPLPPALPDPVDGFRWCSVPGPAFYAPSDPVVLLAGDDPGLQFEPVNAGVRAGGELPCRRLSELVAGIVAGSASLDATALLALVPLAVSAAVPTEAQGVLADALFRDPAQASLLASALGDPGDAALIDAIQQAQGGADGSGPAVTWVGTLPPARWREIAQRPWVAPWQPILFAWEASYAPFAQGDLHPSFLLDHFAWDPAVVSFDLGGSGDGGPPLGPALTLRGVTAIGTRAAQDLTHALEKYAKDPGPDLGDDPDGPPLSLPSAATLSALEAALDDLPILHQSLGGLHDALVMRTRELQLQPIGALSQDPAHTGMVAPLVTDSALYTPRTDEAFLPLRAGQLTLPASTGLTFVDAFGQLRAIDTSGLVPSAALAPPTPMPGAAWLPPRINQPMRLEAAWLPADGSGPPSTDGLAEQVLCGWLVSAPIEQAIWIFDSAGSAKGILQRSADATRVLFLAPPGADGTSRSGKAGLEAALKGGNAELYSLALALYEGPASYLEGLLAVVDDLPPAPASTSPLLATFAGRPLALVRCALQLRLRGDPVNDLSTLSKEARAYVAHDRIVRHTSGLTTLAVPVWIGELGCPDDGVVGFYKNGHDTLYAVRAEAEVSSPNVKVLSPETFTDQLTLTPGGDPVALTLLLDPRQPVHVATGVLPVSTLQLDASSFCASLAALAIALQTGPIVTPSTRVELPVTPPAGAAWAWSTADRPSCPIRPPTEGLSTADAQPTLLEGWLGVVLSPLS